MKQAVGMIELFSIAKGIEACDCMVKAASVELLKASSICPGKYLIMVGGDTGAVTAAMAAGISCGGQSVANTFRLSNVHPQLLPALRGTVRPEKLGAVGVIEFQSAASAVQAADDAAKAAEISLIRVRTGMAIGGKGVVILTGSVGDVRTAIERAKEGKKRLVNSIVIPKPAPQTLDALL